MEEKKGQLKKSKEQEKMREEELEAARQEAKKKDKMVRRIWEELDDERSGVDPAGLGGMRRLQVLRAQEGKDRRQV